MEPDYQSIFEQLPGLYLVLDKDFLILAASDAYLHATLTRRADIVGQFLFGIFPDDPDDPAADAVRNTRASLNRVLQSRSADAMVVQRHDVRRPDSEGGGLEVRYWSTVNSPILSPDGTVAYIVHRVKNVTEFMLLKERQQQAQPSESLHDSAVQMEADLYARSREVADTSCQLKQANEALQKLYAQSVQMDTLKSEFFANVSHELRTPLMLILAPLEQLLQHEALNPAQRQALSAMQRHARLLQRQVGNLLDIAKLEAGRMQICHVRCDLAALVRLASSHFETPAADRRIRFEVQAPASLLAELDAEKVEGMVLNLLSNAFKFTPDGGVIRLSLHAHDGQAVIEVEDNGPGVPEPLREAVFERFRQVDNGGQRPGGTGLGLAIVREFVQLHQGAVYAGASLLGGAQFRIELPRQAPAGTPVADAFSSDTRAGAPLDYLPALPGPDLAALPAPANLDAAHILIVEDHPEMNAFLASALAPHYRISRTFNGGEGLALALRPDRPDLIISDMMMPGMSGDALVHALRQHSALEDVPIVMLTAKADDTLRAQLLQQGVQDYLHKPFSVPELLARVHSLLTHRKRTVGRLRQSEQHYQTLFNSIDEGFCIIEMIFDDRDHPIDYRFLEINPAFEKQTGLVGAQGKRMRELAPDMESHWFECYGQVALTGKALRYESQSQELGRWFEGHAFRYGEAANRQVAILFTDVTARKKSKAALHDAQQRKDQFLSLLAHELRNPLAPIRNGVKILSLLPAAKGAPLNELLPMMERQLAHMARLLDDLLDVSRIANGQIELRRQRMDVRQAVQAAVEANQPLMDSLRHHVAVSMPPQALMLDADPARLTQIVSNLVHNAAAHSPPGSRIDVKIRREGSDITLRVKDNGTGIAPDALERIFEMFVQAGTPFARSHGGLGIGLALVRTLVGLHGGRIEARSDGLGQGSEFMVWLPVAPDHS